MPSVGRYMEELALLNILLLGAKHGRGTLRNICYFLKKLKIYLSYDSVIPLNLSKRSNSIQPCKNLYTNVNHSFFIKPNTGNKGPSTNNKHKQMVVYPYNVNVTLFSNKND